MICSVCAYAILYSSAEATAEDALTGVRCMLTVCALHLNGDVLVGWAEMSYIDELSLTSSDETAGPEAEAQSGPCAKLQ